MEEIYYKALKYCLETGKVSVSHIQRRFPIGYIKSCKIIEWMESRGFISCRQDDGEQKVYLTQEEFDKLMELGEIERDSNCSPDKNCDKRKSLIGEYLDAINAKAQRSDCVTSNTAVNQSAELDKILKAAMGVAEEYGSSYIGSEHLVYAMLDSECLGGKVLKACDVNVLKYADYFKRSIDASITLKGFTPRTKYMIEQAGTFAYDIDGEDAMAGTEHLLLAIISTSDCLAMRILKAIGVDMHKLESTLEKVLRSNDV